MPSPKKTKKKKSKSKANTQVQLAHYDSADAVAMIIKQLGAILTELKFVSQHIIEQITKGRDPLLPATPTSIPEPSKPQVLPKKPIDWMEELEKRRKQEADKRKQIDPWIDYPNLPVYPDWPRGPYEPLNPGFPIQPASPPWHSGPICNTPKPLS